MHRTESCRTHYYLTLPGLEASLPSGPPTLKICAVMAMQGSPEVAVVVIAAVS